MSTSYGVLSTYPPTQCGLATFSSALVHSLRSSTDAVGVVDIVDIAGVARPPEVRAPMGARAGGRGRGRRRSAQRL